MVLLSIIKFALTKLIHSPAELTFNLVYYCLKFIISHSNLTKTMMNNTEVSTTNIRGIINTCPSSTSELEYHSIRLLISANRCKRELNREMTPILIEMFSLGPGNDSHPVVQKLSKWLQDPQRTGEEFVYVIGELANEITHEHGDGDPKDCMYLVKATAEALAVKSPILEGSWEEATWLLLYLSRCYVSKKHGFASHKFSNWIIHVIGDPDICPNPCLRFELLNIVFNMVDIKVCNRTQAIESVLSACSFLSTEYLETDLINYQQKYGIKSVLSTSSPIGICLDSYKLGLNELSVTFCNIGYKYCSESDKKLAANILDMNVSRCSAMLYRGRFHCKKNSTHYTEPWELYGLIALVKTVYGTVQHAYKEFQNFKRMENFKMSSISDDLMIVMRYADNVLHVFGLFKESFETPQLVGLLAFCIMNNLKAVIQINVDIIKDMEEIDLIPMDEIESLLMDTFYYVAEENNTIITALGLEIGHNYKGVIKNIREQLNSYGHFNDYGLMKERLNELYFL